MSKGFFVSLEGGEKAGKSTHLEYLREWLENQKIDFVYTREPGGTAVGEKIRELLLDSKGGVSSPVAEMLLYAAARAQLVQEVIEPALAQGKLVICDRYIDSSIAYQGYALGLSVDFVKKVNFEATKGIIPDITFLFDIDPDTSANRLSFVKRDRIEIRSREYFSRVREGYLQLALDNPDRFVIIDSRDELSVNRQKITEILSNGYKGRI